MYASPIVVRFYIDLFIFTDVLIAVVVVFPVVVFVFGVPLIRGRDLGYHVHCLLLDTLHRQLVELGRLALESDMPRVLSLVMQVLRQSNVPALAVTMLRGCDTPLVGVSRVRRQFKFVLC